MTRILSPSDEVSGYPHGRVPRAVRERQILALAEQLFAERGYDAASMDELARRAGVSKPVIYDLVGSKEDLFRACCERASLEAAERIASAVQAHDEPAARLHAGALAAFRFAEGHRRAGIVLFFDGRGRFADELLSFRRRGAELLAQLLADEAARQSVELDRGKIEAAAHALGGAFEGLALWWRGHPDVPAETLADWLLEFSEPGLRQILAAGRRAGQRP